MVMSACSWSRAGFGVTGSRDWNPARTHSSMHCSFPQYTGSISFQMKIAFLHRDGGHRCLQNICLKNPKSSNWPSFGHLPFLCGQWYPSSSPVSSRQILPIRRRGKEHRQGHWAGKCEAGWLSICDYKNRD